MNWQPIETAPMDGTEIILCGSYCKNGSGFVSMKAIAGMFNKPLQRWMRCNEGYGYTVQCYPTHWIPMPK